MILAIDPGLKRTGWVLIAEDSATGYRPVEHGVCDEASALRYLIPFMTFGDLVIEKPV